MTTGDIRSVRGFADLWAGATGIGRPRRPVPLRPLLDTLGLGLEQVMTHLAGRPTLDSFAAWAQATASNGDDAAITRYHAWYDGAGPPPAERARQAAVMAAAPVFSPDELAAWDRDGVVVLRQAVARHEAAAIADHLWALQDAVPDDPATWYRRRGNGIMVQSFQHPAMEVPRRSPRIHRAFAELYGHADLIASTDRLSFNPPVSADYHFPGPHLHWDASLTPPIPFETQGILYLTDTTADQGALRVVPGFHHRLAAGWLDTPEGRDPRTIDLSAQAIPIPGQAGDLVIWRQDLPHGASPNVAAVPRLAQYITLYPMRWPDERPWL